MGDIKATLAVDDWLKFDWDDDVGTAIENPWAVATFGRYRGNDRIIYWREVKQ
jgi:MSHA biogenesis protein MshQ